MNLLKQLEDSKLPDFVLETLNVPDGKLRGVLLLSEEQLQSYMQPKGFEKFVQDLTVEDLEVLATDDSFFRITGKAFIPNDVVQDKGVLLNIDESIIDEFVRSDFSSFDDAKSFLIKVVDHDHFVSVYDFKAAAARPESRNITPFVNGRKPLSEIPQPVVEEATPIPQVQPIPVAPSGIPQAVPSINTPSVEDLLTKVLSAEKKPTKWVFTIKRNASGFIESIEAVAT